MKNKEIAKSLIIAAIAALASTAVSAETGGCNYGRETIQSLTCYGPANLNGTTVTGKALVFGPFSATQATIGSLQAMGPTTLTSSSVQGGVVVEGPFNATDSKLGKLEIMGPSTFNSSTVHGTMDVRGPSTFNSSTVSGDVDIRGPVTANKSKFAASLRIFSNKTIFHFTTVDGSLSIKSSSETPVLFLQNRSAIAGSVTFEGLPGTVKIDAYSKVTGQVLNGQLGAAAL